MTRSNGARVAGLDEVQQSLETIFSRYDAMPPSIRKMFQEAAFNYLVSTRTFNQAIKDEGKCLRRLKRVGEKNIGIAAMETYGPDHPQARP